MAKKYVGLSNLSTFLDNLKDMFSPLSHTHTTSDITDYEVDSQLSSESTNPVQNKIINAKFEDISETFETLESAVDGKADESHTHNIADVNNLQGTLDEINNAINQKTQVQIFTWEVDD